MVGLLSEKTPRFLRGPSPTEGGSTTKKPHHICPLGDVWAGLHPPLAQTGPTLTTAKERSRRDACPPHERATLTAYAVLTVLWQGDWARSV